MIYFEFSDIYSAIINAVFFGILSGGLYGSLCTLNFGILRFLSAISFAFCSQEKCRAILNNSRKEKERSKFVTDLFDFIFFICVGFSYIFLIYIALDGIFRFYILLFSVLGFYISRRTLGRFFDKIISVIVDFINTVWSFSLFYLLLPNRLFIYKVFIPIAIFINDARLSFRAHFIKKSKLEKIDILFQKSAFLH